MSSLTESAIMYRSVFYLGLFVTVLSVMGIVASESTSYMSILLPSGITALLGLLIGLTLMHYSMFSYLRNITKIKLVAIIIGSVFIGLSAIGLLFPTFFGLIYNDENPINLFILFISGSAFLISSIEKDRESILSKKYAVFKNTQMEKVLSLTHKIPFIH
jgi:uncharacterized integral membrane protein